MISKREPPPMVPIARTRIGLAIERWDGDSSRIPPIFVYECVSEIETAYYDGFAAADSIRSEHLIETIRNLSDSDVSRIALVLNEKYQTFNQTGYLRTSPISEELACALVRVTLDAAARILGRVINDGRFEEIT